VTGTRFRTLRAIARDLGVPERELEEDAARFAASIPCLEEGGRRRYGPAAAAALRLVARLRGEGMDAASISAELGRGPVALAPPVPAIAVGTTDLASALNRRRERRRRGLAALAEALRALAGATDRRGVNVAALRAAMDAAGTVPSRHAPRGAVEGSR